MSTPWRIVAATADSDQIRALREILKRHEFEPICTPTVGACRDILAKETVGLVFCDRQFVDGDYRDLILAGRSLNSTARFVVMLAQDSWGEFFEANRSGAFDVITTPCRAKDVEWMIIQARRDDRRVAKQLLVSGTGNSARSTGAA